jgi:hypothetical protein
VGQPGININFSNSKPLIAGEEGGGQLAVYINTSCTRHRYSTLFIMTSLSSMASLATLAEQTINAELSSTMASLFPIGSLSISSSLFTLASLS